MRVTQTTGDPGESPGRGKSESEIADCGLMLQEDGHRLDVPSPPKGCDQKKVSYVGSEKER